MPEQYRTQDQVEEYLARIFGPDTKFSLLRAEHGWVCHPKPAEPRDPGTPPQPGQANFVVNATTGVVTVHSSLSMQMIGNQYDQAIRSGQPIPGYQVHPPRWRLTLQRERESEAEIEYRVTAESLTIPSEPTTRDRLTIDKSSLRSRTNRHGIPVHCRYAKAWAYANRSNGVWPESGSFEY